MRFEERKISMVEFVKGFNPSFQLSSTDLIFLMSFFNTRRVDKSYNNKVPKFQNDKEEN